MISTHISLRKARSLTLILNDHHIPVPRCDVPKTTRDMSPKSLPTRRHTLHRGREPGSCGQAAHHAGQVIEVGVAVAKEEDVFGRICKLGCTEVWKPGTWLNRIILNKQKMLVKHKRKEK